MHLRRLLHQVMLRHERIHAVGKAFKSKPASHLLARLAEAFQMRAASQIKALSQWFDVTLAVFGQYASKNASRRV
jgi:hypothetical protein